MPQNKKKKKKTLAAKSCCLPCTGSPQSTRAYLDSKVNTLIGFFFSLHPERIRQHAMQTLNSSVTTSPLTVNFILSGCTWPIEQPTYRSAGMDTHVRYVDALHKRTQCSLTQLHHAHILLIDGHSPFLFHRGSDM